MQAIITYYNPFSTDLSTLPSVVIAFAKENGGVTPDDMEAELAALRFEIADATRLCVQAEQVRNIVISEDPNAGIGATDDTIYLIFE